MTYSEAAAFWGSDDLITLGMQASALRAKLDPFGVVTYCVTSDESPLRVTITSGEPVEHLLEYLEQARQARPVAVQPLWEAPVAGSSSGGAGHATEYLKLVALCRLYLDDLPLIQAAPGITGLKVAQLALRFGANDLGNAKGDGTEESFRRLIRDAGFTPQQRDAAFTVCFL